MALVYINGQMVQHIMDHSKMDDAMVKELGLQTHQQNLKYIKDSINTIKNQEMVNIVGQMVLFTSDSS